MQASSFLAAARHHARLRPEELPCDAETFGIVCAYLSALVGEIEYGESQIQADLEAGRRKAREDLTGGYRQFLRGTRPAKPAKSAVKPPVAVEVIEPLDQE